MAQVSVPGRIEAKGGRPQPVQIILRRCDGEPARKLAEVGARAAHPVARLGDPVECLQESDDRPASDVMQLLSSRRSGALRQEPGPEPGPPDPTMLQPGRAWIGSKLGQLGADQGAFVHEADAMILDLPYALSDRVTAVVQIGEEFLKICHRRRLDLVERS